METLIDQITELEDSKEFIENKDEQIAELQAKIYDASKSHALRIFNNNNYNILWAEGDDPITK